MYAASAPSSSSSLTVTNGSTIDLLQVVRKLEVVPKQGRPSLFAVWTMQHQQQQQDGEAAAKGEGGGEEEEEAEALEVEVLVVRDESGQRTAQYVSLMTDMGMPQRPPQPQQPSQDHDEEREASRPPPPSSSGSEER